MEPYQERVVTEKQELDAKLTKLRSFIANKGFESLDKYDAMLLVKQCGVMLEYSSVLRERIARFGVNSN